jgi:NitT/TauT family transport system permease protein
MSEESATKAMVAVATVGGVGAMLAVWQVVGAAEVFGTSISPPTSVLDVFGRAHDREVLRHAALTTGREALVGFTWALMFATFLAVLVVLVPLLRRGVDQLATIESAIPLVALAPILLANVDRASIPSAMAACTALLPMYVALVSGLHAGSAALREVFTVFGSSRSQRFRRAQLPAALPVLAAGAKVAMPLAIVGAVIGEWFGTSKGVGPVLLTSLRNYRMPLMWAAASSTVVVALVLFGAAALLERAISARYAP